MVASLNKYSSITVMIPKVIYNILVSLVPVPQYVTLN